MASHVVTYEVVPVTRYRLMRKEFRDDGSGCVGAVGEFARAEDAADVAKALSAAPCPT